jgi:hypothetical protein|tara:strand:- start:168 stop:377 length:210 start_codon:yes stop_codon:yes gene_type:complete
MNEQLRLIKEITYNVQNALDTAELLHHSFEVHKLRIAIEKLALLEVDVKTNVTIVELCMRDLSYAGIER